ncbi:MAG: hypothetical protein P4L81_00575 [Candidatus Pacebacteria bacterium]|nr:hypothetical protein [Candidatus Paceibacterota bacterium]
MRSSVDLSHASATSEQVATRIAREVVEGRAHIQIGYLNLLTIKLLPMLPAKVASFICDTMWRS